MCSAGKAAKNAEIEAEQTVCLVGGSEPPGNSG